MSVYFQIRFYPNVSNSRTVVLLSDTELILKPVDMERGWVRVEELLSLFPSKLLSTQLTTNAWVVELMRTAPDTEWHEIRRLPVY